MVWWRAAARHGVISVSRHQVRRSYSSSPPSTVSRQAAVKYCLDLVRRSDYDHYLCCLLLPSVVQPAAFAIRAFNVEVAQVHDIVTEQHIGQMRLQFWRDTVESIYKGNPPQKPVALALGNAVKQHRLTKQWLSRILDAREAGLSASVHLNTRDVENYAENTFSALLYLTLEALGVRDVNADHAASHVGKAEGIVTLLRATAYHRSRRRVLLPMDTITRHGASQEDFIRGEVSQAVKDATFDFASLAHTHLNKARSLKDSIPAEARRALLPAVVCEKFLKQIQRADFNPFSPSLTTRAPLLPFSLLWSSLRRTF